MKRHAERLEFAEENDPAVRDEISRRYCRGWAIASQEYRNGFKAAFADNTASESPGGAEWADLREPGWEKLLLSLQQAASKTAGDVDAPKFAAWKVKIARQLRAKSTTTHAWIAEHLAMCHPSRACQLVRSEMENHGLTRMAVTANRMNLRKGEKASRHLFQAGRTAAPHPKSILSGIQD